MKNTHCDDLVPSLQKRQSPSMLPCRNHVRSRFETAKVASTSYFFLIVMFPALMLLPSSLLPGGALALAMKTETYPDHMPILSSGTSESKRRSVLQEEELHSDSRNNNKNEESGKLMLGEVQEGDIVPTAEIQANIHELSNLINLLSSQINEELLVDDLPEEVQQTIKTISMDIKKAQDIMEQEMVKHPWLSHTRPALTQASSSMLSETNKLVVDLNTNQMANSSESKYHGHSNDILLEKSQATVLDDYPHDAISSNMKRLLLQDEDTPLGRNKDLSDYYYYSKAEYIQRATMTSQNGLFPQSPWFNQFSSIDEMMQRGTENQGPQFQHQDGKASRTSSNKQCNAKIDLHARKEEQCRRLAACAQNFNLYDLFIYYFQDDIDFDTGEFKDEYDISFDEIDVSGRLRQIKRISHEIIDKWKSSYLEEDHKCDTLLQKFHRFSDEIGVVGKWQGGSVTSVCRAWGTSKYVKLEQIWTFIYEKKDADFASEIMIDIFEELVGCAGNIVNLANTQQRIFNRGDFIRNPFISPDKNAPKLYLPLDVKHDIRDSRGKVKTSYLDDLFYYDKDVEIFALDSTDNKLKASLGVTSTPGAFFQDLTKFNFTDDVRNLFKASFKKEVMRDQDDSDQFVWAHYDNTVVSGWESAINVNVGADENLGESSYKDGTIVYVGYLDISPHDKRRRLCFAVDDDATVLIDNGAFKTKTLTWHDGWTPATIDFDEGDIGYHEIKVEFTDTGHRGMMVMTFQEKSKSCPTSANNREFEDDDIPKGDDWLDLFQLSGVSRYSFDKSMDLIFGKGTTIGQVCSFSEGMTAGLVDDTPGFCCLDEPSENMYWGDLTSCVHQYGELKGQARKPEDCTSLAPITAGFNQAACDTFSGTWCPHIYPCNILRTCIKNMQDDAKIRPDKKAFLAYLEDAPKIEDVQDVKKCGDVREYFGYDRFYPDDERICGEVKAIQCNEDFSNLDGLAQGSSNEAPLKLNKKIAKISTEPFDSGAKQAMSSTIRTKKEIRRALDFTSFMLNESKYICARLMSACKKGGLVLGPGVCSLSKVAEEVCKTASMIGCVILSGIKVAIDVASFALQNIEMNTQNTLDTVVTPQDSKNDKDYRDSIYDNVITTNYNVQTTFKAVQQVKQMLGELAATLEDDDEDKSRRALIEICDSVAPCKEGFCDCPDVDPRNSCDCSLNYAYISSQRDAGCDEFDSDGDGFIDICEDRYDPEILIGDASLFFCDKANPGKLCYTDEVFLERQHAINFIEFQMKVSDDCAPPKNLGMKIELTKGTCSETVFTVTPWQNYPDCVDTTSVSAVSAVESDKHAKIPFANPRYSSPARQKEIVVQVDEDDPTVLCGFNDHIGDLAVYNSVEEKTLFHYGRGRAKGGFRDANFFFKVDDNCPMDIKVNIVVKSNEVELGLMANLDAYRKSTFNDQAHLYYSTKSCDMSGESSCKTDETIHGNVKLRFYDITVTATDFSGRVGSDTCRIILVPECSKEDKYNTDICAEHDKYFYYKRDHVIDLAKQSKQRYKISTLELDWLYSLSPPETASPTVSPAPSKAGKGKGSGSNIQFPS